MKIKVATAYDIYILYWRLLIPSPSHVLWSVPLSFILSSGHLSSGLPFACSARNRPSIVFILSVNGPHIAGHGEAICPHRDGCILRFLQLHFWQTDIWAHLKPGGITFSRLCNVGIWLGWKPLRPQTWLPNTHRARKSFSLVTHTHARYIHTQQQNEQQNHYWSGCCQRGIWNHKHYPQTVFVSISCPGINTTDRHSPEHKSWINSIFQSIWFNK